MMRFARVRGLCVMLSLHQVSPVHGSSSPAAHGAGIFGSPVAPPLHVSPVFLSDSPTAMITATHGSWRSSPGSPSAFGIHGDPALSHVSHAQQENLYARAMSAGLGQPAASPQVATFQREATPHVPTRGPIPAAGYPIVPPRRSVPQPASPAYPFAASHPATTTDTTSALPPPVPPNEPAPGPPGDLPQLKRSNPWLFSATREKLLGAIHFMKHTEEQGAYFYGNHADTRAAGTADNGKSNHGRHHHHFEANSLPRTSSPVGSGNLVDVVAADAYSRSSHTHPHLYTFGNGGPRLPSFENLPQGDKPLDSNSIGAPTPGAYSADVSLNTGDGVRNQYVVTGPQALIQQELLQQQQQPLYLQHTQWQQRPQQLQYHLQEHTSGRSEPQTPIHLPAGREQGRDTQHRGTGEPAQHSHLEPHTKQHTQNQQQIRLHSDQSSLPHLAQPTHQEAEISITTPLAKTPLFPYKSSVQIEAYHPFSMDQYTRFNVYVSEGGETLADGVFIPEGPLPDTTASTQIPQATTAATQAFPRGEDQVIQPPEDTEPEVLPVFQDVGNETAKNRLFHEKFTTSENNYALQAYHIESREETGLKEHNLAANVHLPVKPQLEETSKAESAIVGGVVGASEFLACEARTTEEHVTSELPESGVETPESHRAPPEDEVQSRGEESVSRIDRSAGKNNVTSATEKTSRNEASITYGVVKTSGSLAPEAHRAETRGVSAEGTTATQDELTRRDYQALTPYGNVSLFTPRSSTSTKELDSQRMFTSSFDDDTKFRTEITDTGGGRAAPDDATPTDAGDKPEEANGKRNRMKTRISTELSRTDTAAAQQEEEQMKATMQEETEELGRTDTDATVEELNSKLPQVVISVTTYDRQIVEKNENAQSAATAATAQPTQNVRDTENEPLLPPQDQFVSACTGLHPTALITTSSETSAVKSEAEDAASVHHAEGDDPRSASQVVQPNSPPVSLSPVPAKTVAGSPPSDSSPALPLDSLRSTQENGVSASSVAPLLVRPSRSTEAPSTPSLDITPGNPADALFPPSSSKEPPSQAQIETVSRLKEPLRMVPHADLQFTAPKELVHHGSTYIRPPTALPAVSTLSARDFGMATRPLKTPGDYSTSTRTTAALQPLALKSTPPGGSVSSPYPISASYVVPQKMYTQFPTVSVHFRPTAPSLYVSQSTRTDATSTYPPAPVYIGHSIRQEETGGPPPVYPLGARLYERMIPRAEFILASSTYAEEYLDLFAALYCLFHKWPCNNVQEFAEETRKRQDEMNSSEGVRKTAA